MKKVYFKLIVIFFVIITFANFNICFGVETGFMTDPEVSSYATLPTGAENVINNIIRIISIVGSGISIIALIILGIKYMLGSLEEKANYKKTLLPYLIGAIFVFGASIVPSIIYNIFK